VFGLARFKNEEYTYCMSGIVFSVCFGLARFKNEEYTKNILRLYNEMHFTNGAPIE